MQTEGGGKAEKVTTAGLCGSVRPAGSLPPIDVQPSTMQERWSSKIMKAGRGWWGTQPTGPFGHILTPGSPHQLVHPTREGAEGTQVQRTLGDRSAGGPPGNQAAKMAPPATCGGASNSPAAGGPRTVYDYPGANECPPAQQEGYKTKGSRSGCRRFACPIEDGPGWRASGGDHLHFGLLYCTRKKRQMGERHPFKSLTSERYGKL